MQCTLRLLTYVCVNIYCQVKKAPEADDASSPRMYLYPYMHACMSTYNESVHVHFLFGGSTRRPSLTSAPQLIFVYILIYSTFFSYTEVVFIHCVYVCIHFYFIFVCTLHNIQLTPQKLSTWRKNHPGAPGAGVWPEDQVLFFTRLRRRSRRTMALSACICTFIYSFISMYE